MSDILPPSLWKLLMTSHILGMILKMVLKRDIFHGIRLIAIYATDFIYLIPNSLTATTITPRILKPTLNQVINFLPKYVTSAIWYKDILSRLQ